MAKAGQARQRKCALQALRAAVVAGGEKAGRMGVAPQADHFFHRVGVPDGVLLREHAEPAGQLRGLQRADAAPLEQNFARIGNALRNRFNQRGFARAVGTGQHKPLPCAQGEGKIIDYGVFAVAYRDVPNFQHRVHRAFLVR